MGQELDKSSVDAAVWKEAVAREAVIRALASSDQPNRAEVLRACRQLGLKRARLYQLLKAYRVRPVTSSLLVRPAGTPRGALDCRRTPKQSSPKRWRNFTRPSRSRASIACIRKFGGYAACEALRRQAGTLSEPASTRRIQLSS